MAQSSKIEWTDATWNPTVGCRHVSPGCKHCYAERTSARMAHIADAQAAAKGPGSLSERQRAYQRIVSRETGTGKPLPQFNGRVECLPGALAEPLHWRSPRRVFVNSQSDLFHEDVPFEFIDRVFAVMALCPQHMFQVLTKRAERMAEYMTQREISKAWSPSRKSTDEAYKWKTPCDSVYRIARQTGGREAAPALVWPLPNVWLGCSVENQEWADKRIPWLLRTPAAVRFLSCEPLLGAIDASKYLIYSTAEGTHSHAIHWVIVGGESGPGARPMHPDLARGLRDQCQAADVPFFFKQWGAWAPCRFSRLPDSATYVEFSASCGVRCDESVGHVDHGPLAAMHNVGKANAGRELDGCTWDEFPQMAAAGGAT